MRQYDEIALDKDNWPPNAVEVKKNPDRNSRVPWIFYNADGEPMCSSKRASWNPDDPVYCGSLLTMDSGRCKVHGGKTGPTGVAHPRFKDGRYSKSLPSRLAARYEEAQNDPDLMSLKSEVQLIDAKVADLLMNAHEGGSHVIFKDIAKAWLSFRYAEADGDTDKMTAAGRKLDELMEEGKSEALVWEQIFKAVEIRRKNVLADTKRQQMLDQYLTVPEVNVLLANILNMIAREVSDRDTVAKVVAEMQRMTNNRARAALPPADFAEGEIEE